MTDLLWAQGLAGAANLGDLLIKALAVAGGAFLSGLLTGVVVQLLSRAVAAAKVPRRVLWFLRLLGTVAGGLVVYFLLFHGTGGMGGWGFGPGWGGFGGGTGQSGTGAGTGSTGREVPTPRETAPSPGATEPDRTTVLQVEVLGVRDGRFYRIKGDPERHTLEEIERIVLRRKEEAPALQWVEVVIYTDSPDQGTEVVRSLTAWVRQHGLDVRIAQPSGKAP